MSGIHKKTAITKSQKVILEAHEHGEELLWARYERQLPLCAFTSNGLVCTKCFNGPCRINPFGDEPRRGICGADREQIVMENIFRVTLEGVLETARKIYGFDGANSISELPDISNELPAGIRKKLSDLSLLPVSKDQIFRLQNSYFSHKDYLFDTLKNLTALGLIQYALLKEGESFLVRDRKARNSILERKLGKQKVNIMLTGNIPVKLAEHLHELACQREGKYQVDLVAQTANVPSVIQTICDHGNPELSLFMDIDALIITPSALPSLGILANKMDIPVVLMEGMKSVKQILSQAIDLAQEHRQKLTQFEHLPIETNVSLSPEYPIPDWAGKMHDGVKRGRIQGVVAIIGDTNVKQTFFERTLAIMENCLKEKYLFLIGGEMAAQVRLLSDELFRRMPEEFATFTKDCEVAGLHPLISGLSCYEMFRLSLNLTSETEAMRVPVLITFPEFSKTSTWATVVSGVSLGCVVQIGSRTPFWGSPELSKVISNEWPRLSGGRLLATPTVPESNMQAREIISFLRGESLNNVESRS